MLTTKTIELFFAACTITMVAFVVAQNTFKECEHVSNGNFVAFADGGAQEHNCIAYIYCNGVDSFTDICPLGTYFDALTQECAFDEDNRCKLYKSTTEAALIATSSSSTNVNEDIIPVILPSNETSTNHLSPLVDVSPILVNRPQCGAAEVGSYFAHAMRCEYYYKCIESGYLMLMRCMINYAWDYGRNECLPQQQANCYKNEHRTPRRL